MPATFPPTVQRMPSVSACTTHAKSCTLSLSNLRRFVQLPSRFGPTRPFSTSPLLCRPADHHPHHLHASLELDKPWWSTSATTSLTLPSSTVAIVGPTSLINLDAHPNHAVPSWPVLIRIVIFVTICWKESCFVKPRERPDQRKSYPQRNTYYPVGIPWKTGTATLEKERYQGDICVSCDKSVTYLRAHIYWTNTLS